MNFDKNENQKMIAQMVRDFAEKEIKPRFMEWDESQEFPIHVFKKLVKFKVISIHFLLFSVKNKIFLQIFHI